jgi:hypothetical protein
MALILAIEEDLWRRLERYHSLTPDIWVDGHMREQRDVPPGGSQVPASHAGAWIVLGGP